MILEQHYFLVTGEASTIPEMNVDSEIISLFARPKCPKPPEFPINESLSLYGVLAGEDPILCAFSDEQNGCFQYLIREKYWNAQTFSLPSKRSHASSVSYGNGLWIIIGGQKYIEGATLFLDTSDILKGLLLFHTHVQIFHTSSRLDFAK